MFYGHILPFLYSVSLYKISYSKLPLYSATLSENVSRTLYFKKKLRVFFASG